MSAFPPGFCWGVATSAYQIEGAAAEDGRGPSIWDGFASVRNDDSAAVACDHYHRLDEDLDLLSELGVRAYRFSVAWPRIQPAAGGEVNPKGLDFYSRLVEGLHRRGIRPFATLYHWDLPQWVQDRGGWPARDTAELFADYAGIVGEALAGGIGDVVTVNEPWVPAWLGHAWGDHAPGGHSFADALAASHHLLLGHGLAAARLRDIDPGVRVGLSLSLSPVHPETGSDADRAAADRADAQYNRLFLDPLLRGAYPPGLHDRYPGAVPADLVRPGDLATIAAPLDFLGVNYYRRAVVAHDPDWPDPGAAREVTRPGLPLTASGWPVEPDGLTELLLRLRADYGPVPVHVTESGAAFDDYLDPDGRVVDTRRVAFLRDHVAAVAAALEQGVDVRGYFVWSLLDNFEWAQGYAKRFGLYYVEYGSQRRVPKSSARWYRDLVAAGGAPVP